MKYDIVYLIVGAVAGALLRYLVTGEGLFLGSIPVSVLIVNVIGSFILGVSATAVTSLGLDERYTLLIGVGFCGSLTTMSTFAFESVNLITVGEFFVGAVDILLNVGASMLMILLGRALIMSLIGG